MFYEMYKAGWSQIYQNPRYWDEDYVPRATGGWSKSMRISIENSHKDGTWKKKISLAHMGKYKTAQFHYLASKWGHRRGLVPTNSFWIHVESLRSRGSVWRSREYRRTHPFYRPSDHHRFNEWSYVRWKVLKRKYGLSQESYENMVRSQNGVCAMCGEPPKGNRRYRNDILRPLSIKPNMLEVDHDHKSGKIRALICQRCNKVLGQYENWGELCRTYLQKIGEQNARR